MSREKGVAPTILYGALPWHNIIAHDFPNFQNGVTSSYVLRFQHSLYPHKSIKEI